MLHQIYFQPRPAALYAPPAVRRCLLIGILLLCCLVPAANASAADNDRVSVVGNVLVDRNETAGDVFVVDGDVTIRGRVTGDVFVIHGDVTIRGTVGGDVGVVDGRATLGRRGRIAGDLNYRKKTPVRAPGSRVGGDVKKIKFGDASVLGAVAFWIGVTISILLLGLILLLIAPKAGAAVARTAKTKALIAALVGVVGFFLLPVIAVLVCFTIVGLPIGILLGLLVLPLYAMGYCAAALAVGRLILKNAVVLAFIVGVVILQVLGLIPIAGALIGLLATMFGLGLVLVTMVRTGH
jgi:hypothetical protein